MNRLNIFSAGVARKVTADVIRKWNDLHPELPAAITVGGSVDLIRKCLAGEPCDILILADDKIIDSMMIPESAVGYTIFAGNRMVIAANEGFEISSDDWKEKLLAPDATFDHHNPYADPGGYRAVMSMMLADKLETGLADKLLNHPGHYGMGNDPENKPEIKYTFDYYTRAAARGAMIADLPEIMNLSNDELALLYAKAAFAVDDENTVSATPICHAITIPLSAKNHDSAKEFAKMFLESDFESYGFIKRRGVVGKDILK